ncbi:class I SAM-dependent methyltransferase [Stygiolobus caldivivus]|nr:class I SAM-dependent methyltransferase [Stygiolobus caldivivus]
MLDKAKILVDVGCGSGQNCIAAKADLKLCLDFSSKQLNEARKRGCEDLVLADMEFMPLRSESADTLLYISSIHHLRDPSAALMEAKRVLKEGGSIMVTVWLVQPKYFFKRNIVITSYVSGRRVERFYKLYLPWELKKTMERVGFRTVFSKNYKVNSILPNNSIYLGKKVSLS